MKKLILLILLLPSLCFGGSIQDAHKKAIARMNAVLTCPTGTYELDADGELLGEPEYACINSGTPVDTTDATAGVAVAGGAINGNIGYLLNADNEHIRWAAPTGTYENAGTCEMIVTTPAAFNHDQALFEIWKDENSSIQVYFSNGTAKVSGRHEGTSGTQAIVGQDAAVITTANTYKITYTWSDALNKHDIIWDDLDSGTDHDLDSETITSWGANEPTSISVGDDYGLVGGGTDAWKVDGFQCREDYEGS